MPPNPFGWGLRTTHQSPADIKSLVRESSKEQENEAEERLAISRTQNYYKNVRSPLGLVALREEIN